MGGSCWNCLPPLRVVMVLFENAIENIESNKNRPKNHLTRDVLLYSRERQKELALSLRDLHGMSTLADYVNWVRDRLLAIPSLRVMAEMIIDLDPLWERLRDS